MTLPQLGDVRIARCIIKTFPQLSPPPSLSFSLSVVCALSFFVRCVLLFQKQRMHFDQSGMVNVALPRLRFVYVLHST